LQQVAPDLCYTRSRFEIRKMPLGETEIAIETVNQNLERVLQRVQMTLLCGIFLRSHFRLRLQPKSAQISEEMTKDLQLISLRKAIELQHDRRVEGSDTAMPDVVRDPGEKDIRVTAFEAAHHRQLRDGVALAKVFAKKERVDSSGVPAHNHVLIIVRKN